MFYLTALLRQPTRGGAYGPYAFGLSGFSPVLRHFAGGPGQLGLHGTNDPSSIGHSVTHGCIRVRNRVISMLAHRLPLGTPLVVTA
jgi:lipoprotein-anchoring transpeptidase ErfK/SrfK